MATENKVVKDNTRKIGVFFGWLIGFKFDLDGHWKTEENYVEHHYVSIVKATAKLDGLVAYRLIFFCFCVELAKIKQGHARI